MTDQPFAGVLAIALGLAAVPGLSVAQAAPTPALEPDVAVKGAVDHYDGEDHASKPETPAQVEVKKKYSPYS